MGEVPQLEAKQPKTKLRDRIRNSIGRLTVDAGVDDSQNRKTTEAQVLKARERMDASPTIAGNLAHSLQALRAQHALLTHSPEPRLNAVLNPQNGLRGLHEQVTVTAATAGHNKGLLLAPLHANPMRPNTLLKEFKMERLAQEDGMDIVTLRTKSIQDSLGQGNGLAYKSWEDTINISLDENGGPIIEAEAAMYSKSLTPDMRGPLTVDSDQLAQLADIVATASHEAFVR